MYPRPNNNTCSSSHFTRTADACPVDALVPSARVLKCLKLIEFGLVRKRGSRNTAAKALQNDKRNICCFVYTHHVNNNPLRPAIPLPPKDASFEVVTKHTLPLFIARCAPSKTTLQPRTCVRPASSPVPPTPRWWATSASALVRSRPTSTCASLPMARPASRSVSRLERA